MAKNCRDEATSAYNARQGSKPRSVFYSVISNRLASFYSRMITTTANGVPYVLDGLMHHESRIEIREHATGSHQRSIFTYNWTLDPRLRRRRHGNLNKE